MYSEKGAPLYDYLMQDAPYERWLEWTNRVITTRNPKMLDVGCGTGTLMSMMLSQGYDVSGVDLSESMLAAADEKIRRLNGVKPKLHAQDMSELSLGECYDVITVFCDSLNYVLDEQDVQSSIVSFYNHLNESGILIFDVHSLSKFLHDFPGFSYGDDDPDVSLIWNSYELEDLENGVVHDLTFYQKQSDGNYERVDETHMQRTFSVDTYTKWLLQAGFHNVQVTADFTDEAPTEESERIFFVASK
ncbi:methyltransferase [Geomicrobium sp. JCM 19037]|uniref:class I SAM-dependent DNA methyltransferase n=1 Tax=unclassified Geomicrobium TaxID=2628951 RepID=UPI00045F1EF4|nr:class I SAM-dependent methyltransferase [Geomicrobium sp. JCM 19037]GAK04148.1 methyltransferase [Geomicrobium sp. JCM 19037]